ncbi:uncharacterized protein A4U43_C04F9520 [Asparagus officinalis]|uniref:Pentacotripeptide-repeat region of PRORP domain-containing protein n=1 Tax=Asparagus officinalis TaxID=4686 RepID=A0A5P1F1C9_ASPOF|nr:pentatricopeptide repeat-containing protein At5g39350 [Asparagus officinalis]ONK71523.1 uncharacterized protein A4U43_C04F9520 [Asparagus officinalis]
MPIPKLCPPLTRTQCISLIGSYTRTKSIRPATQLHALIVSSGLLDSSIASKLTIMYSMSGNTQNAHKLFDKIPRKTPALYSVLIRGHVQNGQHQVALKMFAQMISEGLHADNYAYPFALKACGEIRIVQLGSQIHCNVFVSGYTSDEYVQNCLIAMYMNQGRKDEASMVFNEMGNKSVVSWNTMIAGLYQNGFADEALSIFGRMVDDGFEIDRATVVSVLPACAQLKDLKCGKLVHNLVKEKGFQMYLPVKNSLIDMYSKCGRLEEARRIFDDQIGDKDVVSWTAMIGGYALNGYAIEALDLCYHMQLSGIRPNTVTMASLLSACGILPSISHAKSVHGLCIRFGLESDIVVETTLIDTYSKCDATSICLQVFERGSKRTATWNAIISGFARKGQSRHSIEQFKMMLLEKVSLDFATIASILPAYSYSADMQQAKNLHCYLMKTGFLQSYEITTGLIDVYAKAGCLDIAWNLFEALSVKDFVSWSAMIGGYGMHGHAKTAIWLLDQMILSGIKPNEVTFTSLLYSCSHAGLIDEGLNLFQRMVKDHSLRPHNEHYACVVDLLGRAGKLEEAYGVIRSMPFEANHAVWGGLLGACAVHENVELGEIASKRLFELEPENTGNYVLLGNIYAAVGRWEDTESLRETLKEKGLRKAPGCSLIEANNL